MLNIRSLVKKSELRNKFRRLLGRLLLRTSSFLHPIHTRLEKISGSLYWRGLDLVMREEWDRNRAELDDIFPPLSPEDAAEAARWRKLTGKPEREDSTAEEDLRTHSFESDATSVPEFVYSISVNYPKGTTDVLSKQRNRKQMDRKKQQRGSRKKPEPRRSKPGAARSPRGKRKK